MVPSARTLCSSIVASLSSGCSSASTGYGERPLGATSSLQTGCGGVPTTIMAAAVPRPGCAGSRHDSVDVGKIVQWREAVRGDRLLKESVPHPFP